MQAQILAPAAVLVLWSMLMLLWMAVTRFSGMAKIGVDINAAPPGGRGIDLEPTLPASTNWKSHNYTHLMEQPTLFYATIMTFAFLGATTLDVRLAWGYVGLRILHSLWQATVNKIPVRFALFLLSTICLMVLSVRAVMLACGQA